MNDQNTIIDYIRIYKWRRTKWEKNEIVYPPTETWNAGLPDFASIIHLSVPSGLIRKDISYTPTAALVNSSDIHREELLRMSVFDIDPFMDRVRWPKVWETLCCDCSAAFESRHRRKDGTIFPVEVTVTLIEFNDNRYSMAFFSDITERKRVFESSRITQFIFDKAPLGIFLIRDGGDITNVNDYACQYLGYTREELCRMNVFDFDRGHSPQEIDQIWQRQKQNPDIDTFETVHRRKDGTDIPVEITGIRLMFDNIPYSVSFVKDISERKEAEKKRNKMEAQMNQAQKMESLGTLAGGICPRFLTIFWELF